MILDNIRSEVKRIRRLKERSDTLKASLMGGAINYDKDQVHSSPSDKMCDIMTEAMDIDADIERRERRISEWVASLIGLLGKLSPHEKNFIHAFYFDAKTMTKSAEYANISERTAYRMNHRIRQRCLTECEFKKYNLFSEKY